MPTFRLTVLSLGLALVAACTTPEQNAAPKDLGAFDLRVNYVFADKAVKGPISRPATPQEWVAALESALEDRLGRYDGPQHYDIGVSLEGYMLAPPGVPVLYSPKSTAIVLVHVYDVQREKFLARSHQLQVFEDTTQESFVVGSGLAREREEQLSGLAENVAERIELWLAEEHAEKGWFKPRTVLGAGQDASNPAESPATRQDVLDFPL
ncbi:hypothetical protein SAMN05444007_1112 [Cribrihabitans marinus]|uniref:DUF4136 domain-containing protein n=1 Tax=Cribrihabitans marinus TaxID=1227549 RepID=A0A1H7DKP1_9RHOB|nr:hypothetical protein [Cribrihabitans marinus]GGH38557.1 hypothetical protein GCM10010973_33860 [Cribrihabitans marinus]SEJ99800.1 hypothetical protein SAMN05444007_1112 [Cribrihabitans marinus]